MSRSAGISRAARVDSVGAVIRIKKRQRLAGALAACALVAAGCGSSSSKSSGVSAATYVKSVCTAATSWKNAIQTAGTQLEAGANAKSLPKTKTAYVSFVGALVNATGSAESQLSAAGTPSVTNGKTISTTLVQIFTKAKGNLTKAASDAAAIPTGNSKDFQTAAGSVETEVKNALASMSTVAPEKNPQLHAAAAKDPTCKSLASAG